MGFTGAPGEKSPDRLDAAVHAITDLMGYGLRLHADSPGDGVASYATPQSPVVGAIDGVASYSSPGYGYGVASY